MDIKINVKKSDEGQRIDKFLTTKFLDFSRAKIQFLIKKKLIKVNSKEIKASYKLVYKDKISISENKCGNDSVDIPVLYDSKSFLVVDKPPFVQTHKVTEKSDIFTVADFIKSKLTDLNLYPDKLRAGIVHRLDKDTSGLLILTKNITAYNFYISQFKDRKIEKKYECLVLGILKEKSGIIDAPVSRYKNYMNKMCLSDQGKPSITHYKVKSEFKLSEGLFVSLLTISPKTGRTHQIRVHMAGISHPIIGDHLYGKNTINSYFKDKFKLNRLFLHAISLKLPDFDKNKELFLKSQLYPDLKKVLDELKPYKI